jgi:hypothetical protein
MPTGAVLHGQLTHAFEKGALSHLTIGALALLLGADRERSHFEAPLDKISDYAPDAASRRDDTPRGIPQIETLKTAQVRRRRQALSVEMIIDQLFIYLILIHQKLIVKATTA